MSTVLNPGVENISIAVYHVDGSRIRHVRNIMNFQRNPYDITTPKLSNTKHASTHYKVNDTNAIQLIWRMKIKD